MLVKRVKTRGREVQQQEYVEKALIRDSDLSGGRGGSRTFFRRGCTRLFVYFNTNKPHSFLFSFCRIPVVLENRRSSQGGGCAPPAPSPQIRPCGGQRAVQLLNNWGREYSSSPWTNLSTFQGGGGGIAKISQIPFYKINNDVERFLSFPGA